MESPRTIAPASPLRENVARYALLGYAGLVAFFVLAAIGNFISAREVVHESLEVIVDLLKALIAPTLLLAALTIYDAPLRRLLDTLAALIAVRVRREGDRETES